MLKTIPVILIGLAGYTYAISFGFRSCSTSENEYAESGDEFTLTYFDGNKQFECIVTGENGSGGSTYKCSDRPAGNDVTAYECLAVEPGKYGLQISNPYNPDEQEDDICVDAIIVNGAEYPPSGQVWVGDGGGSSFQNYIFYATAPPNELGDLESVSGVKVAGIPACFSGCELDLNKYVEDCTDICPDGDQPPPPPPAAGESFYNPMHGYGQDDYLLMKIQSLESMVFYGFALLISAMVVMMTVMVCSSRKKGYKKVYSVDTDIE
eukprot:CAMPEP_0201570226 /NCGR_PEP_ID=MMETSP0190_2-20130828/12374_1 /ASSEMBLY_ACC=CAM_ASM_000263 /TAXON_ID=37353 /ORGANISM="Rosalina sp." /LENGTH=264 /DNA_ID=CAMNT_0047993525 /DNA_START=93 /DNA_END=887 /DNA_ORIENTATION=+